MRRRLAVAKVWGQKRGLAAGGDAGMPIVGHAWAANTLGKLRLMCHRILGRLETPGVITFVTLERF